MSSRYPDHPFFRGIPPEILDDARFRLEEIRVAPGTVVCREGDAPDYLYLILDGEVEITIGGSTSEESSLRVLGAGSFCGELAMIDGGPRSATITALTTTRLGRIDQASFDYLYEAAYPQLTRTFAEINIERTRRTNALLASGQVVPPEGRRAGECPDCRAIGDQPGVPCDTCGRCLDPAPVPTVLAARYRMLRRIGEGGMGVVYQAFDPKLDRLVAVKTLPAVGAREAALLGREALSMAKVPHSRLAVIYDLASWRGTPMLVVEYLPGGTLEDRLRSAPLPVGDVLKVGVAIGEALCGLHGAGLLHRDVKPSNIGFAADETAKLLDFGLARVLDAAQPPGPDGEPPGTLLYLSPEAAAGAPPDVSWDLWALCVTLYEAIAGRHPVAGGNPHGVRLRIIETAPPDIRELAPTVPAPVAELFLDALALDRRRRPASALALLQRLGALARE